MRRVRDSLLKDLFAQTPIATKFQTVLNKIRDLEAYKADKHFAWPDEVLHKIAVAKSLALAYRLDIEPAFDLYAKLAKTDRTSDLIPHAAFFLRRLPDDALLAGRVEGMVAADSREGQVLRKYVAAFKADKAGQKECLRFLIAYLGDKSAAAPVTRELWPAPARLEESKNAFAFAELALLPKSDADASALARIAGHALERLAKEDQWLPTTADVPKCLALCATLDRPSDWIVTLKAECLLDSGMDVPVTLQQEVPKVNTGWYGNYVHALLLEKNKDQRKAADLLMSVLKENRNSLKPAERRDKRRRCCGGPFAPCPATAGNSSKRKTCAKPLIG